MNKEPKCKQCGYYVPYSKDDGTPESFGICASISFNKECYEGKNPFRDVNVPILEVEAEEESCPFYKKNRTKRVREYIEKHSGYYYDKGDII